jgi:hypothetical protein
MESFGNETATYSSRLPLGNVIYEGSFRQWLPALANPVGNGIRWIFMRDIPGNQDEVYIDLQGTAKLDDYRLVYNRGGERVYKFTGPRPTSSKLTSPPPGTLGTRHAGATRHRHRVRHGHPVRRGAAQ